MVALCCAQCVVKMCCLDMQMHKIMKIPTDAFHKTCGCHSGQLFGIKVCRRENPGVKSHILRVSKLVC